MRLRTTAAAALAYFGLAFAAACELGVLRQLALVPCFGPTVGVLLEAPLMIIAILGAAHWTLHHLAADGAPISPIPLGLVALAVLVVVESAGAILLRGLSVRDYTASFATSDGAVLLALFLVFAAMPVLLARHRSVRHVT
jgi:hypothetical protein